MTYDFNTAINYPIPNLMGGEGTVSARVLPCDTGSVMCAALPPGASIGMHAHTEDTDYNFVMSGRGKAVCDGVEEPLFPGVCHICYKGSSHTIINTGEEDLVICIAVVNM